MKSFFEYKLERLERRIRRTQRVFWAAFWLFISLTLYLVFHHARS